MSLERSFPWSFMVKRIFGPYLSQLNHNIYPFLESSNIERKEALFMLDNNCNSLYLCYFISTLLRYFTYHDSVELLLTYCIFKSILDNDLKHFVVKSLCKNKKDRLG